MKVNQTIRIWTVVIVLLVSLFSLQGCAPATQERSAGEEFQISFKLDPRLLGPTYGGEHWVPPPYGPVAYSGIYTLEARTFDIDSNGREMEINAEWISADPNLATVTPDKGNRVTITIQAVGETSLLVKTAQGTYKTLYIKVTAQNDSIRLVEISQ